MTFDTDQDDELQASINVTPLVDVLLVLLVVFMVVPPMLKRDLPVDLPATATGRDAEAPPDQMTLTATADGRLLVNGAVIEENGLAAAGVERIGIVTRVAARGA